ncbi:S8 family serine peptidase [Sphingomonas sp. CARO-RG-8B-R24-01]|uniref:S8 family serine peptidase n=1 Tax=Sphingomonas sp. CARO-RG-8B-R24-01 TaxID=2914831 RepID=UPI001F56E105|nr:S8 family serine peptidase [Sphingomonas sp. CARO-RG-8B-R24-01]
MDPALQELIGEGGPNDDVAVVVRLKSGAFPPTGMRIVARFGEICTIRARRAQLAHIRADPAVASMKAPRVYAAELDEIVDEEVSEVLASDIRRPDGLVETGKNVVLAVLDWGCDFTHPDFRNADGTTRIRAIWDQRGPVGGGANPYGYGTIYDRAAIDRALHRGDPFGALGYAFAPQPQHGTHVLGIAAGNGRGGGPAGVAPEAEIVFCHLGAGEQDLGNSVELLEALDFAVKQAGDLPLAINTSVGRQAGPHDDSLLLQQAIDWVLTHRPGTAIAQSTGNYFSSRCHMAGRLHETEQDMLPFRVERRSATDVVIETWYPGSDEFHATVEGPAGAVAACSRGHHAPIRLADGTEAGVLYHRAFDPNNGDHLINLVLKDRAPLGEWRITLTGVDVVDGRWHSWIERDAGCPSCQVRFREDAATPSGTTGSICNALRTIAVGAHDAHGGSFSIGPFSSVGPTRDGRAKPLLTAPGVKVLSCRSFDGRDTRPRYICMSGTSMASPHVAGALALMLQAAGRQPIAAIRRTLFATLDHADVRDPRGGYGMLAIEQAVVAARTLAEPTVPPRATRLLSNPDMRTSTMEQIDRRPPSLPGLTGGDVLIGRALDPADKGVQVVGWCGRRPLLPVDRGDVITDGSGQQPVLVGGARLFSQKECSEAGLVTEGPWPGQYVQLLDPDGTTSPFARRIAGPDGLLLQDIVIVRPVPGAATAGPPGRETFEAIELMEADARPVLRTGSSGPSVIEAQTKLNAIHDTLRQAGPGLDRCPLTVDGLFGPRTRAATVSFQKQVFPFQPGEWDGVIGAHTWAKLDELSRPGGGAVTPIVPQSATIEIVLDPTDSHAPGAGAPVATAVMLGLWNKAYDPSGDILNGEAETDNFIGLDSRRFYIRVRDPQAAGPTVIVQWKTVDAAGSDFDAPASQDLELAETSPGSKLFVSKAVMLVADETDANQKTHSGFASGAAAGIRFRGQSNHRLRKADLDSSVLATYARNIPFLPISVTIPVFERSPEARLRLDVRVVVYRSRLFGIAFPVPHVSSGKIARFFQLANERWAQVGLRIFPGAIEVRDLPARSQDANGQYIGLFTNDQNANARDAEGAVLDDLLPGSPDSTLTAIFVVSDNGANGYAEFGTGTPVPIGERFFIFVNPLVAEKNDTLAHEFHHCIFNRFDDTVDDAFFAFNTFPPQSIARRRGITVPDPRIYRRIPVRHTVDPNLDPRRDNVINWVKRVRTALEPVESGPTPPATPTTGNTFVRSL